MSLNSVEAMEASVRNAAGRRILGGTRVSALLVTGSALMLAGSLLVPSSAMAQIRAPRYQSPIEAPKPQLTLPTPPAITPNGTVVEDAIVRVNDQIIDRSDYIRSQQQLIDEARQTHLTDDELASRQKDLLRDMIDQQLLLSRGKELDISADSEVIRRLDDIRKQNKFDSMEDLEKAVRQSGVSYEDFKANIKNSIITQQVVRDEVGKTLRLTAKDEQAYYEKHKQEYEQPEQVRLSEILIPTPDAATDEQVAQAKAKADDVVAKLKAGANFDDLAKQFSGGQSADKGGDLGEFKRGQLGSKALEDPTFVLKAGENTAPIRTRQGFVILKVIEHTQAGIPPMSAVDDQLQEAIYREAIQPALRTYLTSLREKAYIDIAPGFVDSGASAKQSKPLFAAYAPPTTKKKAEQKARLDQSHAAVAGAGAAATTKVATATPTAAKAKPVSASKKQKKIRKEKIRFGQAPRNSLPASPEETLTAGADQGPGAASSVLPAPGAAIAPINQTAEMDEEPLAPKGPEVKKSRYSDRAPVEDKARREASKAKKAQEKRAAVPVKATTEEKAEQQVQTAPLGLGGDTATKTKKKKVKGAAKERLAEQAPAPAAAKPEATPIPPKSVRVNGEPVVTPAPDPSTLPPVTVPATVTQPAASTAPTPAK
ncbi:MAG: peptidylprolyl isomerase [Acidobacteriaceae bacterium]|nr:peptidylprolyl isomerase [Acidobacteriaceae bacterium]